MKRIKLAELPEYDEDDPFWVGLGYATWNEWCVKSPSTLDESACLDVDSATKLHCMKAKEHSDGRHRSWAKDTKVSWS